MLRISSILREYSNEGISRISGYPPEQIHMLRKNEIDSHAIKTDSSNRPVPVRTVMEKIIEERFNNYAKQPR